MGSRNRYQGFDPFTAKTIRRKVDQLIGRAGYTECDRQDLEQEFFLDLLQRLPKFDPCRSRRNTFVVRVVDHKIASLLKSQRRSKHGFGYSMCSLDDAIGDLDEGERLRSEIIGEDEVFLRTGRARRTVCEDAEVRLDVKLTVSRLPPKLRRLCDRLEEQTVTEICRETGASRSSIYDRIKQIRLQFEDAGLNGYL